MPRSPVDYVLKGSALQTVLEVRARWFCSWQLRRSTYGRTSDGTPSSHSYLRGVCLAVEAGGLDTSLVKCVTLLVTSLGSWSVRVSAVETDFGLQLPGSPIEAAGEARRLLSPLSAHSGS